MIINLALHQSTENTILDLRLVVGRSKFLQKGFVQRLGCVAFHRSMEVRLIPLERVVERELRYAEHL